MESRSQGGLWNGTSSRGEVGGVPESFRGVRQLLKQNSFDQIGDQLGVTGRTVRRWLSRESIPRWRGLAKRLQELVPKARPPA